MVVMILWGLANIGFTMCLSTCFEDPKLAQSISGLIYIVPIIVYFGLVIKGSTVKYWVYAMMPVFPMAPSASILLQISTRTINGVDMNIAHVEFISRSVSYALLIWQIPFWLVLYTYLE